MHWFKDGRLERAGEGPLVFNATEVTLDAECIAHRHSEQRSAIAIDGIRRIGTEAIEQRTNPLRLERF